MCKPSTSAYCLPTAYNDYENASKPYLAVCNDTNKTSNQKRQASEFIGTFAAIAYNARRHGLTFGQSLAAHVEFRGCGVVDLLYLSSTGAEIKEAKGGSGGFGDRKDHLKGGRAAQCTIPYLEVIIDLMVWSNYRGRHPEVACATHTSAPKGTCKDCKAEEKSRRRKSGADMYSYFYQNKLEKHAVRGGYNGDCLKEPAKMKAYKIVNGTEQTI
jgi:hypothetical protein